MKKVFIDGSAGTTGLRIVDRLKEREDIDLLTLSGEDRKDDRSRKRALNDADIAILCLPDEAARCAVSMIENKETVVIDTSSAHRTEEGWTYGFPELSPSKAEEIKVAKRIAVPGCHASGFLALVYPLIEDNIIDKDVNLSCFSITGYSGGGKKMINEYEAKDRSTLLAAPRQYGISQEHKHLKEMRVISGLKNKPIFSPIVANYYSGMELTVPIFKGELLGNAGIEDVEEIYRDKYHGPVVQFCEDISDNGYISANKYSSKDSMHISVQGNEDRILLIAVYDNLGKGASGAAIQCLNLVLGQDDDYGLNLYSL